MRTIPIIALVAACAGPAPAARATDGGQLDCMLNEIPGRERAALALSIAAQRFDASGEALLRGSLARCRTMHNWSEAEGRTAALFAVAALGAAGARKQLEDRGLDVAALEQAVLSDRELMEEVRAGASGETVASHFAERNDALIARMVPEPPARRAVAALIGTFAGYRATMEIARRQFGAN